MDYRELPPAPALAGLVKVCWTLEADGEADNWIAHQATPDGCVEIIRRLRGRSRWGADQPDGFVVGLSERPVTFEISGDSAFAGVRLWPWAWQSIGEPPLEAMRDRWLPLAGPRTAGICEALPHFDRVESLLLDYLDDLPPDHARIGRALAGARSVAEMREATGMAPRRLQRWFADHVGLSPRRYLRLLRFQQAFERIGEGDKLADHAAAHGYADQAHMAREFRAKAGRPASRARDTARGPFLS